MRPTTSLCLTALVLLAFSPIQAATIPAFPGAEGFGAYANGGRGGDVYIVTNLNTSGAGSFADAIATVPTAGRTIVFAVSGHIHVNKTRLAKSKVTIAGQTAPGDGIGFKDGTFIISGDDVVIRHARFRYLKHVGLYAYTADALASIVQLAPSALEKAEALEQLRWLENGLPVRIGLTDHPSFCVDTPADLEEARKRVQ